MTATDDPLSLIRQQILRATLFTCGLSFFLSLLQLAMPLFMLQVYDRVLNSRSIPTLVMLAIVTLGALLVLAILEFLRARIFHVLSAMFVERLSLPTLQATLGRMIDGPGEEPGQAIRSLNELRGFLSSNAISVPFELLWTPLFLIVLFLLHPLYGLVAIVSAVVLILLGVLADLVTRRPLREARQADSALMADIGAAVRHAEAIDAMGMLPALARRWRPTQSRMLMLLDRGNGRGKAVGAASRWARLAMQIAVISTGAVLIIDHAATPGSMIAANVLMGRLLMPFEQLIGAWRHWMSAQAARASLRDLLDASRNRRNRLTLPRPEGHLAVDQLVYVPPGQDRPVLKGLSFSLEPGEVLGVIGPSAAGKSTLARLLVGIAAPSAGGVYLDGHSVFQWERESFGAHVGYLPQSVSLLNGTVRENIARMGEADANAVIAAARKAGVHEMIGRLPFGYETPVGENGLSLSGGQRQRIALARALFGDPRLLVLDEPNANLDHEGEQALLRAIHAAARGGAAVVLIAHRPSVMMVADKLLVLKDGRIEQFGPRAEILPNITPRPQIVREGASTAPRPLSVAPSRKVADQ